VVLGDDEVARGEATVKWLRTGARVAGAVQGAQSSGAQSDGTSSGGVQTVGPTQQSVRLDALSDFVVDAMVTADAD
jgi:histidyl-tRNA synthetase